MLRAIAPSGPLSASPCPARYSACPAHSSQHLRSVATQASSSPRLPAPGPSSGPQKRLPTPPNDGMAAGPAEPRRPADLDEQPEASVSGSGDDSGPEKPQGLVQILVSYAKLALAKALGVLAFLGAPLKKLLGSPGNTVGRFALLFFSLILVQGWHASGQSGSAVPTEVLYSQFVSRARAGIVHSAIVDDHTNTLYFSMDPARAAAAAKSSTSSRAWWRGGAEKLPPRAPANTPAASLQTYSTRLIDKDTSYVRELVDNGVHFGVKKQTLSGLVSRMFGGFLALWIPLIPFLIIFKRVFDAQSGKSKPTKQSFTPPDTTFADVAGVDVVKAELEEAIQCLRNPGKFEKLNAQMPSGVLLSGPPGTGKTLLARAVAGEAGVPFFAVSASEFVEMFVGRGAARIRELFAQARKAAPSVVFIDELDAVGGKRGLGVNDERDQTLNQLLTELDGFERRPQVLLLAATNRPEVLDPALLRPGRISRRIVVPLPDRPGRREILGVHLRSIPMESLEFKAEAIDYLSSLTMGFSGAELYNVVNEGALLAARRNEDVVSLTDLVNGVTRTRNGVNAPGGAGLGGVLQKISDAVSPKAPMPARSSTMT